MTKINRWTTVNTIKMFVECKFLPAPGCTEHVLVKIAGHRLMFWGDSAQNILNSLKEA
jgi:hypothetical protein